MRVEPILHLIARSPLPGATPMERAAASFSVVPGPADLLARKADNLPRAPAPVRPIRGSVVDLTV